MIIRSLPSSPFASSRLAIWTFLLKSTCECVKHGNIEDARSYSIKSQDCNSCCKWRCYSVKDQTKSPIWMQDKYACCDHSNLLSRLSLHEIRLSESETIKAWVEVLLLKLCYQTVKWQLSALCNNKFSSGISVQAQKDIKPLLKSGWWVRFHESEQIGAEEDAPACVSVLAILESLWALISSCAPKSANGPAFFLIRSWNVKLWGIMKSSLTYIRLLTDTFLQQASYSIKLKWVSRENHDIIATASSAHD